MNKLLRLPRLLTFVLVVIGLAIVGYLAYKSMVLTPEVAEIAQSTGTCQTNITSISLHDECSPGMFKKAIYSCTSGAYAEKLASNNCFSYESIIAEAQNNCGQTCTGQSPIPPRPSPTPEPPCIPNPCKEGMRCIQLALPKGQFYCPPAPPSPSLKPSPSPIRPSLDMTSFKAEKPCGPYGFSSITYGCNNNKILNILTAGQCVEFKVALAKAQSSCAGGSE